MIATCDKSRDKCKTIYLSAKYWIS